MKKIFKIYNLQSVIRNSPSPHPSPLRGEGWGEGAGFTLIEIAIVLVILGLLVTLGASMIGPLTKRAKLNETREAVKSAKEAVIGYVVKNGYLPADLKTAGARELDAGGNQLVFYRAVEFDTSPEDACGVISTTLGGQPFEVRECTDDSCSAPLTKSDIGFIVFSKGSDANEAGTDPGKDGLPPFYVRIQDSAYPDGAVTYNYDDVVQYSSLDEIRSLRGCSQTLAIISSSILTDGEEDSFYSYEMKATGGRSPYTWSITGQTINTLVCTGNSYPLTNPNRGLCLYRDSGLISGTININTASSTGEFTVCPGSPYNANNSITVNAQVTDLASSPPVSYTGTIPIRPKSLSITTQTLPDARTGVAYSRIFQGTGGRSSYTWSVVGQTAGTFGCAAGNYPITGSNTGLCLNSTTGALSGTPTAQGTYNFTVSLADTCTTASNAYTLNVVDSCFVTGINILNIGNTRYVRRGAGACNNTATYTWANGRDLNAITTAAGGVQPVDTYYFYRNANATSCSNACTGYASITYSQAQGLDANENCQIRFNTTGVTCTGVDN
ncbi:MAG: putative Ig domain-containing protein [Thermodesulfovibrionia bacterium]|nr:putative Ig domain-containing protein [Thermodesulfovibrionia bacterium]